jgi:peroxiredoxin
LLCDTEKTLCVAYGACDGADAKSANRITYVIDPEGNIAQVYEKVDARKHPETLLEKL